MVTDDPLLALDVEGPVQLEVFVLTLGPSGVELTGPCGPTAWYLETTSSDHPVDVVTRIVTAELGRPDLVHSTSWRQGSDGVILSFFVVVEPSLVSSMPSRPVGRTALARSRATAAPTEIRQDQVLEHALRHLAWLAEDDDEVRRRLSDGWLAALEGYVPELFRNL
jgi:hypothetical protein